MSDKRASHQQHRFPSRHETERGRKEDEIFELYSYLDDISQDNRDKYAKAQEAFQTFFQGNDKEKFEMLLDKSILSQTPSQNGVINTDGDSLLFRAMTIPVIDDVKKGLRIPSDDKHSKAEPAVEVSKKEVLDNIIKLIIKSAPEMICFKEERKSCEGITPIHVAILKTDVEILNLMADELNKLFGGDFRGYLSDISAHGYVFRKTAMMAETLLGVAALTCKDNVFNLIKDKFATGLTQVNSKGDNVIHSLIKYAHEQPNKRDDAKGMLERIISNQNGIDEDNIPYVHKLMMMSNNEKLTPLQLAAKLQQFECFMSIMKHKVYCTKESHNGLVSEDEFDITEIETLAIVEKGPVKVTDVNHESILEYLVHHEIGNSFRFASFLPIKEVIKEKWMHYKYLVWLLFVIHLIFMALLSTAAVYRSLMTTAVSGEATFEFHVTRDTFVTVVSVVGFVFGILFLAIIISIYRLSRFNYKISPGWFDNIKRHLYSPYSNCLFQVYFCLFYILLVFDFILSTLQGQNVSLNYSNECLTIAVIIGWYISMLYLQVFKPFGFFTVLIQRVIFDMLRFSVVMFILLIAFSIAMFMVMQGAHGEGDDFSRVSTTMWKMLTIMLGLGELDVLFQARQPGLAISIFVLFVLLTSILLLNALIALMSHACTDLLSDRHGFRSIKMHCWLQRLSVILSVESFLPRRWCKEVGDIRQKKGQIISTSKNEKHCFISNSKWTRRRYWSLSSANESKNVHVDNIDKEEDVKPSGLVVFEREIQTLIDKLKGKVYPEQTSSKIIDITDIQKRHCEVCKAHAVVDTQTLIMNTRTPQ